MRGSSARSRVLVALWAVCACDEVGGEAEVVVAVATPAIEGVVPALATAPPPPPQGGLNATLTATQGPPAVPEEEEEAATATAASPVGPGGIDRSKVPLGRFVSERTTVVYAEPRWESGLRGRIEPGNPFSAFMAVEGEGCEGGWAQVQLGGYVCLRHAVATDTKPEPLPRVAEGGILPFVYAKPRADRKGQLLAEVPRYRSVRDALRGAKPVDSLVAHRQYAFTEVIRRPSVGDLYVDLDGQAVPGRDLVLQKPSELEGRVLAEAPVPAGLAAAWSVSLPAELFDGTGRKARSVGSIAYHSRFELDPTPIAGSGGVTWLRVPGAGKEGADAYVDASQVRYWDPGPELDDVDKEEVWIDVDVQQQMLGLRRGAEEVLFLTLVSTGTGKHPTPRGIFRIRNKLALGKMENRPDEPESYYVEEVPWVQYFYKRFAFHTAYWHRSFGRRRSHGCINLSPRDAAFLFGETSPEMPEGWTSAFEHEGEAGTTVRVRKGDDPLPDRRRPLGSAEEDEGADEPAEAGASDDEGEDAP